MADYDNTDRGSLFKPFPETALKLQGRLNVNGVEYPVIMVKQKTSRDGPERLVLYMKIGILFDADKNGNDKAPDFSGPLELPGPERRVAAWKGHTEKAGHFLTLRVSEKHRNGGGGETQRQGRGAQAPYEPGSDVDDDPIPF